MKIDDMYKHLSLINQSSETSGVRRNEGAEDAARSVQDSRGTDTKVDLSTASVEFSKATEMMDQESAERIDKVNELRAKIANGEYEVDSTQVAEKMLRESIFDFLKS